VQHVRPAFDLVWYGAFADEAVAFTAYLPSMCTWVFNTLWARKSGRLCGGQAAWIINDTVRGNILFGKEFDEGRYGDVIEACSLSHDLQA